MSSANDRQPGGDHYQADYQHWDFCERNGLGYLESAATKYATRWRKKSGLLDLEKALHYTDKLIELHKEGWRGPRGCAPLADVSIFSEANDLIPTEENVVLFLSRWKTLDDLNQARAAICRLIEQCGDRGAYKDTTGQENPRGFDEEQDVG